MRAMRHDPSALVPAVGVLPDRVPGYEYAAANSKGKYILYFVDERLFQFEATEAQALSVTLKLPAGQYTVRTFDTKSGETTELPPLQSNGFAELSIPEFNEDVAVLVDKPE